MNNLGSVRAILKSHNLGNKDLVVVHDEIDLPWTGLRIRKKGSAAGHNGVRSLIAAIHTDWFTRVRVGIHPNREIDDAAIYVLAPWERAMRDEVDEMVGYAADAVEFIIAEGAIKAMTRFNRAAPGKLYKKRKNENLRRVIHRSTGCHRRRSGAGNRTGERDHHAKRWYRRQG